MSVFKYLQYLTEGMILYCLNDLRLDDSSIPTTVPYTTTQWQKPHVALWRGSVTLINM
jgi:hypothetical protein